MVAVTLGCVYQDNVYEFFVGLESATQPTGNRPWVACIRTTSMNYLLGFVPLPNLPEIDLGLRASGQPIVGGDGHAMEVR